MKYIVLLIMFVCFNANAEKIIYVSPLGNDNWQGKVAYKQNDIGPVKTLERAKQLVYLMRQAQPDLKQPVVVQLLAGVYRLNSNFFLGRMDSGTEISPTIYRGYKKDVVITGSISLPKENWNTSIPQDCEVCKIYKKIKWIEIEREKTNSEYPTLLYMGKRVELARMPNKGYYRVNQLRHDAEQFRINVNGRLKKIYDINNIKAYGFWQHDWSAESIPVAIDTKNKQVKLLKNTSYRVSENNRYFLRNDLSWLDSPNEWYFDYIKSRIFFWPNSKSLVENPELPVINHLLVAENVEHVHISNITFQGSKQDALILKGVSDFLVDNCTIKAVEGWAVTIQGASSGVSNSVITDIGRGGVMLTGGDRKQLKSGGLFVRNSAIQNYATSHKTYNAGVQLVGVGAHVFRNIISDSPHVAILISGNNHLIEQNMIKNVVNDSSDSGAIYMGRDWTEQGNIIRDNYFENIVAHEGMEVKGIYLDDEASGTLIQGNIFNNVEQPVFVGGGFSNKVSENIFMNSYPTYSLDNRGERNGEGISKKSEWIFIKKLMEMPYNSSQVWLTQYRDLSRLTEDKYGVPFNNEFVDNIVLNHKTLEPLLRVYEGADKSFIMQPNILNTDSHAPSLSLEKICIEISKTFKSPLCR